MQFSMNNTVPEPDRSMDVQGFNNVPEVPGTGVPQGMGVKTLPHPLEDEVIDHSNTIPLSFPSNGTPGPKYQALDQVK